MAETANIAEIATKISDDIFSVFLWEMHPLRDSNFSCNNTDHRTESNKPKQTHPCDVVFSYNNPYANETIYLNTDLKSFGQKTLTPKNIRGALKSLVMAVSCAVKSEEWKTKYSVTTHKNIKIKGMLFLYNHDQLCSDEDVEKAFNKVDFYNLNLDKNVYLHLLKPNNILMLLSIANYIQIKMKNKEKYTFYYPDLCLFKRSHDIWNQAATLESLLSPFFILKYQDSQQNTGYYIFYNETGKSIDEFIYLIDALSQYQMLESNEQLTIVMTNRHKNVNWKSNFIRAKDTYKHMWQLNSERHHLLDSIVLDTINYIIPVFIESDLGWRINDVD